MTHTIQQVIDKLTTIELWVGSGHPAFAKAGEAITMLKDMQVVDVEVGERAIDMALTRVAEITTKDLAKACAAAWGLTTKEG